MTGSFGEGIHRVASGSVVRQSNYRAKFVERVCFHGGVKIRDDVPIEPGRLPARLVLGRARPEVGPRLGAGGALIMLDHQRPASTSRSIVRERCVYPTHLTYVSTWQTS